MNNLRLLADELLTRGVQTVVDVDAPDGGTIATTIACGHSAGVSGNALALIVKGDSIEHAVESFMSIVREAEHCGARGQ